MRHGAARRWAAPHRCAERPAWCSPSPCPACARRRSGSGSAPPAPTSRASRWGSPTCWSTWCSRAPSGGAPRDLALALEVAGRQPRRLHRARHTSYQAHVLDARPPARGGRAHRPGPPAAAPRRAISSPSGTSCSRRSTASTTRRTTWSSSCTPRRSGPTHPYGYSILGTPETLAALIGRRPPAPASDGLLPRQLRDRGRRQRGPRPAARGAGARKAGSRAPTWNGAAAPVDAGAGPARCDAAARSATPPRPTSSSAPTPFRSATRGGSPSRS